MSASLASYNVEPKRADSQELMQALLACQTGIASPNTRALMNHIAWLQQQIAQLEGKD